MVNEMGKLFRGHNIIEYKSPDDQLDIDAFYKASAYGCLYKAYGSVLDERPADDITVSLVRYTRPDGLFGYFGEHQIHMTNPYAGIYYVTGAVLFPTQIIVGKELGREGHTWLKALSDKVQKQEMRELLEKISSLTGKLDRELADSVLEVTIRANEQVVEDLRGEDSMCQALLEIMKPEIDEIRRSEVQKGKIYGVISVCRDLGQSDDEILKRLQERYHLSRTDAEKYLQADLT